MYKTICELAEKQLENINESNHDYRSILINLKLINSLFYKIIPAMTKSLNNLHQPYSLATTISQMLNYVEKCNKVSTMILCYYL